MIRGAVAAAFALLVTCAIDASPHRRPAAPRPVTQYRGDAGRTGVTRERGPLTLQRERWSLDLDGPVRGIVYADGVVYAGASDGVFAFDAASGTQLWSHRVEGRQFTAVAIRGMELYAGGGSTFFALSRLTGAKTWSIDTDASIGSAPPLIIDGFAYVGSDAGSIYAIDLESRAIRWKRSSAGGLRTYLAGARDLLIATQNGGVLRALDGSGETLWTKTLRAGEDWTEAAVDGGVVYAGASGNDFYALDAATGAQLWKYDDANSERSGWSAPVIADGVVYAGNRNRRMFAFEAATGRILWRVDTDDAATTDPSLASGLLLFGVGSHGAADDEATRNFYAVDARSGAVVGRFPARGLVLGGCAAGDGAVFFHTLARRLFAVD